MSAQKFFRKKLNLNYAALKPNFNVKPDDTFCPRATIPVKLKSLFEQSMVELKRTFFSPIQKIALPENGQLSEDKVTRKSAF